MPLEYQCLRCCSCEAFQAKQVTKTNKFSCTMCGTKQTVQRVYAISGSAKDIRLHVQKLKLTIGTAQAQKEEQLAKAYERLEEAAYASEQGDDDSWDAEAEAFSHLQQQQQPPFLQSKPMPTDWSEFADIGQEEGHENDCADEDPCFVTSIQDKRGGRGGGRRGKAGSRGSDDQDKDSTGSYCEVSGGARGWGSTRGRMAWQGQGQSTCWQGRGGLAGRGRQWPRPGEKRHEGDTGPDCMVQPPTKQHAHDVGGHPQQQRHMSPMQQYTADPMQGFVTSQHNQPPPSVPPQHGRPTDAWPSQQQKHQQKHLSQSVPIATNVPSGSFLPYQQQQQQQNQPHQGQTQCQRPATSMSNLHSQPIASSVEHTRRRLNAWTSFQAAGWKQGPVSAGLLSQQQPSLGAATLGHVASTSTGTVAADQSRGGSSGWGQADGSWGVGKSGVGLPSHQHPKQQQHWQQQHRHQQQLHSQVDKAGAAKAAGCQGGGDGWSQYLSNEDEDVGGCDQDDEAGFVTAL